MFLKISVKKDIFYYIYNLYTIERERERERERDVYTYMCLNCVIVVTFEEIKD